MNNNIFIGPYAGSIDSQYPNIDKDYQFVVTYPKLENSGNDYIEISTEMTPEEHNVIYDVIARATKFKREFKVSEIVK